jgi:pimeloyl-ACP methyl ester carboxylesterase
MPERTIVFIHGMYMTPLCWEHWIPWFEKKGYRCLTPAWPGREAAPKALRAAHPDPRLGALTLQNVVDHLEGVIRKTREKPVLIGHSMGALAAQLLLQRGVASAAVAIDSAPPSGVITAKFSFLKSNWPHITPFTRQDVPVQMTLKRFSYTFVHTLTPAAQQSVFDRYVVPESRRIPRQSLGRTAHVDFKSPHAPLLLIAGSEDHIIPASLNMKNFRRYADKGSITTFREFPGRTHFIIGQDNWQEVAQFINGWLTENVGKAAARKPPRADKARARS